MSDLFLRVGDVVKVKSLEDIEHLPHVTNWWVLDTQVVCKYRGTAYIFSYKGIEGGETGVIEQGGYVDCLSIKLDSTGSLVTLPAFCLELAEVTIEDIVEAEMIAERG